MTDRSRRPPRVAGHGRRPLDERTADGAVVATAPPGQPVVDAEVIEPETPEPETPGSETPGSEAPGSAVVEPGVGEPDVVDAEIVDDEIVDDEIVDTEIVDAAVVEPETLEPAREAGVTSPPLESEAWAGVSSDVDGGSPGRRGRRVDRWVAGVLVLALAAVVLGGVDLVRRYVLTGGAASLNSAQSRSAVTAALNAATPLTSYDYATTAATKLAAAKPLVTSGCATSYQKDLTTLAGTLDPLKVVETVSFSAGGVQSTGPGTVTVLVFGERTAKDSRSSTPQVSQLQVALTMVHQGGRWLVDGVVSNGSGGSGKPTC